MRKQSDMPGTLALAGAAILVAAHFLWPHPAPLRVGEIQRAVEARERIPAPVDACASQPGPAHPQTGAADAELPTRLEFALLCRPQGLELADEEDEADEDSPNLARQPAPLAPPRPIHRRVRT